MFAPNPTVVRADEPRIRTLAPGTRRSVTTYGAIPAGPVGRGPPRHALPAAVPSASRPMGDLGVPMSCALLQRPDHRVCTHVGSRPWPAIHAERQIRVAAISRLLSELRRKSVDMHLVVLVFRPWSHRAFNHLTHSVDRLAFPDADAEVVIVRLRMDWQCNVGREPSFECLGLGGLKAFGVMNSVDNCYKHGCTVRSSGQLRGCATPLLTHPTMARSGASEHHHVAAPDGPPGSASSTVTGTPDPTKIDGSGMLPAHLAAGWVECVSGSRDRDIPLHHPLEERRLQTDPPENPRARNVRGLGSTIGPTGAGLGDRISAIFGRSRPRMT